MMEMERKERLKEEELAEKLAKMPLDYTLYSTEDEEDLSDYEVTAEDLHPRKHPKK